MHTSSIAFLFMLLYLMMTDKKALEEFALSCFHNDSYARDTKSFMIHMTQIRWKKTDKGQLILEQLKDAYASLSCLFLS